MKNIPSYITMFCFFDETGLLNSPRDKFFGVGMIKIQKPEELYLEMKYLRDRLHFYDEIKWSDIYKKNAPVMMQFIDLFYKYGKAKFSCYIFAKNDLEMKKYFKNDLYAAYESLAAMQVCANLNRNESAILIMDDLQTPLKSKFERNIRKKINNNTKFKRDAAYGVCRMYSKGVELIQLADLFLGAVCYEFKLNANLIPGPGVPKTQVLDHLKKKEKVKTLAVDMNSSTFNIWKFKK